MNVLRRSLCAAGLHSGPWSHPGARCESTRVCTGCGRNDEVVQHTWGAFAYLAPDRCEQMRRCTRCGTTQTRTQHVWGPWLYANTEFDAPQIHRCRRCHETEKTRYTLR
ncbi:hypothetical protein JIG36_12125 [Actinoplanes sp. LDG1-06]|uniref:Zinc-binding domain-containing protein n=1 Tax=Paractinoplanes ovalisporus TaxID=2810368 RepID=A0ABS2A8Z7_9ACTN|nr:hypothetical protein [Actinoplanes ovalisporus]MBM2616303.1 hypothetical protein [Actinoplanes ovalisporus]